MPTECQFVCMYSPPSSLEHSLGGPCVRLLFKLCCANAVLLPIALNPLKLASVAWFAPFGVGPKRGRGKNVLPNTPGTPNCRNGAHGGTPPRFRGAKCAAAAAYSCSAGCRPALWKFGKPWCSRTILKCSSVANVSADVVVVVVVVTELTLIVTFFSAKINRFFSSFVFSCQSFIVISSRQCFSVQMHFHRRHCSIHKWIFKYIASRASTDQLIHYVKYPSEFTFADGQSEIIRESHRISFNAFESMIIMARLSIFFIADISIYWTIRMLNVLLVI